MAVLDRLTFIVYHNNQKKCLCKFCCFLQQESSRKLMTECLGDFEMQSVQCLMAKSNFRGKHQRPAVGRVFSPLKFIQKALPCSLTDQM